MTAKKELRDRVLTAIKAGAKSTHEILAHLRMENNDGTRQKVRYAMRALEKSGELKAKKEKGEFVISEA